MTPTVEIHPGAVMRRFEAGSIPEDVRNSLRMSIPPLTQRLADRVRAKLVPGVLFKTSTRLLPAVRSRMIENAKQITGRVDIDPSKFPEVVAQTLESGSRPHVIEARNAAALHFFWARIGKVVNFKRVNHPGFAGRSFMQSSLDEMQGEIVATLTESVVAGING